jgi:hypothetical protein
MGLLSTGAGMEELSVRRATEQMTMTIQKVLVMANMPSLLFRERRYTMEVDESSMTGRVRFKGGERTTPIQIILL